MARAYSMSSRPTFTMPVYPDRVATEARAATTTRASPLGVSMDSAMRQRRDDVLPLFSNAFSNIPAYFANLRAPDDRLEIEVSLGILVDRQYNARVRQSDWFAVRNMCAGAQLLSAPVEETTTVDYWYDNVDGIATRYNLLIPRVVASAHNRPGGLRVTTDAGGGIIACQVKTACLVQNIEGNAVGYPAYDARININYEQNLPALLSQLQAVPEGWTHRRSKTRYRYRTAASGLWTIDLTVIGDDGADTLVYEVEFELMIAPATMPIGPVQDVRNTMAETGRFAWQSLVSHAHAVRGRRREIGPAPMVDVFGDWQHADDSTARQATTTFARGMGFQGGTHRPFVGAMPVELTRERWLNAVVPHRSAVWVAEKTDGIRLALVFDREKGVCTLDRNGTCYSLMSHAPEMNMALMGAINTATGATALDAELVVNDAPEALDHFVVVIFDLVMDRGTPQSGSTFAERQEQMRSLVNDRLAPALAAVPAEKRIFGMRAKRFVPLDDFDRVWARLGTIKPHTDPPERLMHYDDRHQFVADGFVMIDTSDTRHVQNYKWKPARKSTVDFFGEPVRGSPGAVSLSVSNGDADRLLPIGTTQLSHAQLDELARIYVDNELMCRHPPRSPSPRPLFECRYDADTRQWVLVRFRTDKRNPNHFSVLVDALQALINPLTLTEIREALA